MARIRTIKPSFFKSDDVSVLPLRARLTWIGLWTQCDDQGRTKDHVKLIKADVWPLDPVSLADIEEDLEVLARHGRIVRYEFGDERYLQVTNWTRHQKINRPTASHIPPPPLRPAPAEQYDSEPRGTSGYPQVRPHGALTEASRGEGKGREGKGDARELTEEPRPVDNSGPEPPRNCLDHIDQRDPPPCGRCAAARRAHESWHAARRARLANAPRCPNPEHRGQLAHNCALCRSEQLALTGRTGEYPLIKPRERAS